MNKLIRRIIFSPMLILMAGSAALATGAEVKAVGADQAAVQTEVHGAAPAPVLDPEKFFGNAKAGYMAAKEAPDVCLKLFCYCGCDLTDEHNSLLDCFTSDHGVDCHICQEEALIGLKMKRQGKSIAEIQKAVDIMFYKQYPFDEVSPALKKYRAERLWKGTEATVQGQAGGGSSGATEPGSKPAAARKRGSQKKAHIGTSAKVGSCCSGHRK